LELVHKMMSSRCQGLGPEGRTFCDNRQWKCEVQFTMVGTHCV